MNRPVVIAACAPAAYAVRKAAADLLGVTVGAV